MKTLFSSCALTLFASLSQAGVGTVINDTELRAKPSIDAKTTTRIKGKVQIEMLETQGAWVEVKTAEGNRGWLRLMNIRPGEKKHWTEKVTANVASVGSVGSVVRTASTSSTATTGVKGISKEELENAKPNFEEVKLLDRFQVTAVDAQKFAKESKIKPQMVNVLLPEDDVSKP